MSHFDKAIEHVLQAEGGYVDNPADPGGATNWGITQGTLKTWRGVPVTKEDVRQLPKEEACRLYRANYWTPYKLDDVLNEYVALALFDQIVNRGPQAALTDLQQVLGVTPDGKVGPVTLAALNRSNPGAFLIGYVRECCDSYAKLVVARPALLPFLRGWLKRALKLLDGLAHLPSSTGGIHG